MNIMLCFIFLFVIVNFFWSLVSFMIWYALDSWRKIFSIRRMARIMEFLNKFVIFIIFVNLFFLYYVSMIFMSLFLKFFMYFLMFMFILYFIICFSILRVIFFRRENIFAVFLLSLGVLCDFLCYIKYEIKVMSILILIFLNILLKMSFVVMSLLIEASSYVIFFFVCITFLAFVCLSCLSMWCICFSLLCMISLVVVFVFFFVCFSVMESLCFFLCVESCSTSFLFEATGCFFIIDLMLLICFKSLEKFLLLIFRFCVVFKIGMLLGNCLMIFFILLMYWFFVSRGCKFFGKYTRTLFNILSCLRGIWIICGFDELFFLFVFKNLYLLFLFFDDNGVLLLLFLRVRIRTLISYVVFLDFLLLLMCLKDIIMF